MVAHCCILLRLTSCVTYDCVSGASKYSNSLHLPWLQVSGLDSQLDLFFWLWNFIHSTSCVHYHHRILLLPELQPHGMMRSCFLIFHGSACKTQANLASVASAQRNCIGLIDCRTILKPDLSMCWRYGAFSFILWCTRRIPFCLLGLH